MKILSTYIVRSLFFLNYSSYFLAFLTLLLVLLLCSSYFFALPPSLLFFLLLCFSSSFFAFLFLFYLPHASPCESLNKGAVSPDGLTLPLTATPMESTNNNPEIIKANNHCNANTLVKNWPIAKAKVSAAELKPTPQSSNNKRKAPGINKKSQMKMFATIRPKSLVLWNTTAPFQKMAYNNHEKGNATPAK